MPYFYGLVMSIFLCVANIKLQCKPPRSYFVDLPHQKVLDLNATIANRVLNLEESATLASARKSREMREQGIDVVSLSLGEPDFDTPDFIKEAAKKAIDDNFSHYPPVNGFLELREAISNKFKRDNNLDYTPSQITVSTGAKQCIANVVMALINEGDEVLLPAPYWVSYKQIAQLAGAKITEVKTSVEENYKLSAAALDASLTQETKLIIFSSPSNPTGSTYSQKELEEWAKVLEKYPNTYILADEIYELISFEGTPCSLGSFPSLKDRVITVNGLSKGFAMTGYRLGYMGLPNALVGACNKLQGQFTSGANAVTQQAAITAVNANPSVVDDMKAVFKERRAKMLSIIQNLQGFKCNQPEGAFYLFPDISELLNATDKINTDIELCDFLLEKYHLAMVPGTAFGLPQHIRISYAASNETLDKAMERLTAAVKELLA